MNLRHDLAHVSYNVLVSIKKVKRPITALSLLSFAFSVHVREAYTGFHSFKKSRWDYARHSRLHPLGKKVNVINSIF